MPPSEGALMKNEETFFKGWQKSYRAYMLSYFGHVQLFVTLWTVAFQAPLSMGFSRWEYWSGCHALLLQGIFLTQGSNPSLLCLLQWQAGSLPLVPPAKPKLQGRWSQSILTQEEPGQARFQREVLWTLLPSPTSYQLLPISAISRDTKKPSGEKDQGCWELVTIKERGVSPKRQTLHHSRTSQVILVSGPALYGYCCPGWRDLPPEEVCQLVAVYCTPACTGLCWVLCLLGALCRKCSG